MNRQHAIQHTAIIFTQWSRKAYAVFASLGEVVNIGRLKMDLLLSGMGTGELLEHQTDYLRSLQDEPDAAQDCIDEAELIYIENASHSGIIAPAAYLSLV